MRLLFAISVAIGLAVAQVPVLVCDAGPGPCLASALTGVEHTCHAPLWAAGEAGVNEGGQGHDDDGSCSHQIVQVSLIGDAVSVSVEAPHIAPLAFPLAHDAPSRDDAALVVEPGDRLPALSDPCLRGDRLLL